MTGRSERYPQGYRAVSDVTLAVARIVEAAAHTEDVTGKPTVEVLAEWVIEREALFTEIVYAAQPILAKVGTSVSGGAFDKEATPGVQRRWVRRLRDVLLKGKRISDWRLGADRPLTLVTREYEELDAARVVIEAVAAWETVGEGKAMTLAKAERRIMQAMREYRAVRDPVAEMTERTRAWASSEEGQQQIRESLARAQETIAELEAGRKIDWQRLHEPMSI